MSSRMHQRIVLAKRPVGVPKLDDFALVSAPLDALADGELLIQNAVFALDPATRGFLDDRPSYLPPVQIGDVVRSMVLGTVVQSRHPGYQEGDIVRALAGWEEYSRVSADALGLERVPVVPGLPLSYFMGSLGPSGLTAYVGLHRIGEIAPGQTVVISAASGAVGNVAGQIAKIRGCRAVGIVGSAEKAALCRDLGYDATVDYRAVPDLGQALASALPDGADIYFDNVGGATLDAMLPLMKVYGRIVICGMIANYNDADNPYPIRNLWQLLVKRATMRGFLTYDHADLIAQAQNDLNAWALSGKLKPQENVTIGIENTPAAFIRLMSGQTSGKTVVRLSGA